MVEADRPAFAGLLATLAEVFNFEFSKPALGAYWRALKELPLARVDDAVEEATKACTFMPRPAELRKLAGQVSSEDRALAAWRALSQAIGRQGAYRSVHFEDEVIAEIVDSSGGWRRVCGLKSDELHTWFRKTFEQMYLSLDGQRLGSNSTAAFLEHKGPRVHAGLHGSSSTPVMIAAPYLRESPCARMRLVERGEIASTWAGSAEKLSPPDREGS